jgi:hypothetical protein
MIGYYLDMTDLNKATQSIRTVYNLIWVIWMMICLIYAIIWNRIKELELKEVDGLLICNGEFLL